MNDLKDIQTVKIQGQGYFLNGIMSIPKADGNSEYELIKQWIAEGNEPEVEFSIEEIKQQELQKKKQEALKYLEDTKWYIERLADPSSGKAVPEDVLTKRAEARDILNELKGI